MIPGYPILEYAPRRKFNRHLLIFSILLLTAVLTLLITRLTTAFLNSFTTVGSTLCVDPTRPTLQMIRSQIEFYKTQHAGSPPAQSSLRKQMTNPTNSDGDTTLGPATPQYPFGPYLGICPTNPTNGQSAIGSSPTTTVGWVYTVTGHDYTLQAVNTAGNGTLNY